jgi:hypothetical protein
MTAFPVARARGRKAKRWERESISSDIDGGIRDYLRKNYLQVY